MYHQPHPWNWFVKRPGYVKFMIRELTAAFVAAYLIFLLVLLSRLNEGEEAFVSILDRLAGGPAILLHVLALIAALWHSITWFNLTPKAMPLFIGETRVANPLVAIGMGYLPWVVLTTLVLWGVWA